MRGSRLPEAPKGSGLDARMQEQIQVSQADERKAISLKLDPEAGRQSRLPV